VTMASYLVQVLLAAQIASVAGAAVHQR